MRHTPIFYSISAFDFILPETESTFTHLFCFVHMDTASTDQRLTGLSQQEVNKRFLQYGYNETTEKRTPLWKLFLSKFWNISAWMLESIIILSLFLHNYSDAAVVSCFLIFNAVTVFVQDYKSSDAVKLLKKKLSFSANVLRDGSWKSLPVRELVPGDVIRLRTGDFVPADLQLIEGTITVNESSLTGESGGVNKNKEDTIFSGSVIIQGEATALVVSTGKETFYGKTIELLNTASPESHIDKVIGKILTWLSLVIGGMLLLALAISFIKGISVVSILPVMVILFMNAIPVSMTVMFSVNNAIGARGLLKEGVLVTRMNAPDDAAGMDILCVDKTGTLTINQLTIEKVFPAKGFTEQDVLFYGSQASLEANDDAIDMAFIEAARKQSVPIPVYVQKSFAPFTPQTRKTEAVIESGNKVYSVYKGSFDVIGEMTGTHISTDPVWQQIINDSADKGFRILAVAKSEDNKTSQLVGLVALFDPPREDAKELISKLQNLGVSVMLLTGDALPVATELAEKTGIGTHLIKASGLHATDDKDTDLTIYNGIAEVYPEDKYKIVKMLQAGHHIVGMTGDGINDAPALKQAEVGIAVESAADVAKSAASIILTGEGLQGIIHPIRLGRVMFERYNLWLLNKLGRTLLKICFIVSSLIFFNTYVVSTTVLLLLMLLTDFIFISTSNDKVPISSKPAQWNMPQLVVIGSVQGILMAAEALLLLYIGWHFWGLDSNPGQLYTFCYITLLFYSLANVFVIREKRHFWSSKPGRLDTVMVAGNFILGFILSLTGLLELKSLSLYHTLCITGYILLTSFLINDSVKFLLYRKYQKNSSGR